MTKAFERAKQQQENEVKEFDQNDQKNNTNDLDTIESQLVEFKSELENPPVQSGEDTVGSFDPTKLAVLVDAIINVIKYLRNR